MIAIVDFIATLPNHLGQLECKFLNHWQVVGYSKHGLQVYDLSTGTLKSANVGRIRQFIREMDTTSGKILVTKDSTFTTATEANDMFKYDVAVFPDRQSCYGAIKLTGEMERFVKSMVESKVEGDEIVKGLKALGVEVDVKIRKNFLGGWMVTNSDTYTAEENQRGVMNLFEWFVVQKARRKECVFTTPVKPSEAKLYESSLVED